MWNKLFLRLQWKNFLYHPYFLFPSSIASTSGCCPARILNHQTPHQNTLAFPTLGRLSLPIMGSSFKCIAPGGSVKCYCLPKDKLWVNAPGCPPSSFCLIPARVQQTVKAECWWFGYNSLYRDTITLENPSLACLLMSPPPFNWAKFPLVIGQMSLPKEWCLTWCLNAPGSWSWGRFLMYMFNICAHARVHAAF